METAATSALQEAKLAVMREVRMANKDKKMVGGAGGYAYAGIESILSDLRPEMVKNGLTLSPIGYKVVGRDTITLGSNKVMQHIVVEGQYILKHVSGESEPVAAVGEGSDSLDKAANKAMTAAYKYAHIQAFALQTGHDDPDDYSSEDGSKAGRENDVKPEPQNQPDWAALLAKGRQVLQQRLEQLRAKGMPAGPWEEWDALIDHSLPADYLQALKNTALGSWLARRLETADSLPKLNEARTEYHAAKLPEQLGKRLDEIYAARMASLVDVGACRKKFDDALKALSGPMHENQPAELMVDAYQGLPADQKAFELNLCKCKWITHFLPKAQEEDDLEYLSDQVAKFRGHMDKLWVAKLEAAIGERRKAIQAQQKVPA